MQRPKLEPTAEDGYEALRAHVVARADAARRTHGPRIDLDALKALLADPAVMRFPTELRFASEPLGPGEFAWAQPLGDRPSEGFAIVVHPHFEDRLEDLPLLVAYHVVSVNYLDVATHVEAELFGAHLLGLEVEDYYARLCALADELPGRQPCSSTCSCGGA